MEIAQGQVPPQCCVGLVVLNLVDLTNKLIIIFNFAGFCGNRWKL